MCIVLQTARENSGKAQQAREILEKLREGLQEYEVQMLSKEFGSDHFDSVSHKGRPVENASIGYGTYERGHAEENAERQPCVWSHWQVGKRVWSDCFSVCSGMCGSSESILSWLSWSDYGGNTSHMQEKQEKYDLKSFEGGSCTKGMEECRAGSREDIFILSGEDGDTSKHCQRCIFPV